MGMTSVRTATSSVFSPGGGADPAELSVGLPLATPVPCALVSKSIFQVPEHPAAESRVATGPGATPQAQSPGHKGISAIAERRRKPRRFKVDLTAAPKEHAISG